MSVFRVRMARSNFIVNRYYGCPSTRNHVHIFRKQSQHNKSNGPFYLTEIGFYFSLPNVRSSAFEIRYRLLNNILQLLDVFFELEDFVLIRNWTSTVNHLRWGWLPVFAKKSSNTLLQTVYWETFKFVETFNCTLFHSLRGSVFALN